MHTWVPITSRSEEHAWQASYYYPWLERFLDMIYGPGTP